MKLTNKRVLVTGGTGSLGQSVIRRLLSEEMGKPEKVIVFSRDEAKQHYMRLSYLNKESATDEIIYRNFQDLLTFRIGDIRDYSSVLQAVLEADVIIHAAALKQVPICEYFPFQAVQTNVFGVQNLIRSIRENKTTVEKVIGISTDKACKPINVMGMTKALMERHLIEANIGNRQTRFTCVRYGNVVASRGSVVPLFLDQIKHGGPVTITVKEMTRFLLTLDQAVDTVFAIIDNALPGEIYVPSLSSIRILELAKILINGRDIPIQYTGIRPGEKLHEILISEEEGFRTFMRGAYYVIRPMLPELADENADGNGGSAILKELSSEDVSMDEESIRELMQPYMEKILEA